MADGDGMAIAEHSNDTRADRRSFLGLDFDALTLDQAVERVLELARTPSVDLILTPNVDHVIRATTDPEFAEICRQGSLVVADGQPVVWASRWLGDGLPERVAGSDLMPRAAIAAARAGLSYYFVGGSPGDAQRAAVVIAERAGRDGACGVECPPMGFENDPAYVDAMIGRINAAKPDLLFVGLGSPKQEKLMMALRDAVQVRAMMAVGVTFSFVAGTVRRAPMWTRRLGMEWAWRLMCEPRRLWRRYCGNLITFPWMVLRARICRDSRRGTPSASQ